MSSENLENMVRVDGERMRQVGSGDVHAFNQIMKQYSNRMIAAALAICGRRDEAEDIVQDSLLQLWQLAPDWQPKSTINAFLKTVVTRKAIDAQRRNKFQAGDVDLDVLVDTAARADDVLASRQDRDWVHRHLARMSPRQRAALVLAHFDSTTHQQAAKIMGMETEAYSSLLARARRALRQRMEAEETGKRKGENNATHT